MSVEMLTVSTKGQVVIPSAMRKKIGIEAGTQLAAYMAGDVLMLKPVHVPTDNDFLTWLDEARQWASDVGYEASDVAEIIDDVRSKKRAKA